MKPNVLFLVIDSLRADRFYGRNRSCKTPNIDSLIQKGIYFNNTISSSDTTGTCLGTIFTGMYSLKTNFTQMNYNSDIITLFDILKNYDYNLNATIPDLTWFHLLIKNFDDYDTFRCTRRGTDSLFDGLGDTIIDKLSSKTMKQPWLYYIHLEDLHPKIIAPENFNEEKFGTTDYDKVVSSIDSWLGKFLEKIDLENTLIVITADHGDPVPVIDNVLGSIPNIQFAMKKGKDRFPILEPIGLKLFIGIRKIMKSYQKHNLTKKLSSDELRTLAPRASTTLFEETQHVPLLFVGNRIKNSMIIDNLISGVDILQTLLSILGIKHIDSNLDGRNLQPLIMGESVKDTPIYIESGDSPERKIGFLIGIRTSNYRYYRSRKNPNEHIRLFDVINDPSEKNNIASEYPNIVKKMEEHLSNFISKSKTNIESNLSNSDEKKISDELKKLGYI